MMGQATLLTCGKMRGQPTGGKKEALAERLLALLDVTPLPAI